jgi:hypothetical protein
MRESVIFCLKTEYRLTFESISPGEFHPQALTDRYVTVSRHTAPVSNMLETSRSQADIERNPVPPSRLVDLLFP